MIRNLWLNIYSIDGGYTLQTTPLRNTNCQTFDLFGYFLDALQVSDQTLPMLTKWSECVGSK